MVRRRTRWQFENPTWRAFKSRKCRKQKNSSHGDLLNAEKLQRVTAGHECHGNHHNQDQ